ncbi:MAG: hypothetical protein ACLPVY_00595 [Acidimicrobiia bacterium]
MPCAHGGEVADHAVLRDRLRHVYWVGGGSGTGKSTVARRLATQHCLYLYGTDEVMADHGRRISPEDSPFMMAFAAMDIDERWVNRSSEQMLETFHWFRGEGFGLIVEDLLALPKEPPVIAEGFRLLPHLVQPLLATPTHAVWLLPTPDLRRVAFECRRPSGAPWTFVDQTSDPDRALRNLLERDRMFTDGLIEEAKRLGLHTIDVDASMSEDDVAEQVNTWFCL